jgi:hypothetical protein
MPQKNPYSLKRLEELCDIADEQMALLLQSTLKDFPAPIIDKFFSSPKLNNPRYDCLVWADLISLSLIAMGLPALSIAGRA